MRESPKSSASTNSATSATAPSVGEMVPIGKPGLDGGSVDKGGTQAGAGSEPPTISTTLRSTSVPPFSAPRSEAVSVIPFADNRLQGLMREVEQAIGDCDDPTTLWRLACALKLASQQARGRKFQLDAERLAL